MCATQSIAYRGVYEKLGIRYTREIKTGKTVSQLGMGFAVPDGKIQFVYLRPELKEAGLKEGDQPVAFNGKVVICKPARRSLEK